jgi:protein involved in polysaccharide export with SLBB domain
MKRTRATLGCVAMLMGLVSVAAAQTPPDMGPLGQEPSLSQPNLNRGTQDDLIRLPQPTMSGPVNPKIYRLGPGDILQLQFWGRMTRSWLIQVGPEGHIMLPSSGSMAVSGRTLEDVRAEALKRLQAQYNGVNMDLRLGRPRVFKIYLTGDVKTPGPIDATAAARIADVVNSAALLDNASHRHIEVTHTDGSRDLADIELFALTGDQSLNPWLRDGDVISVPVAMEFVWAQGALGRGGKFELGTNDSLLTLFRLAGDPIPSAEIDNVLLVRWKDAFTPDSVWIHLDDIYDRRTNPALRDGDRLYVYYIPKYHLQHEVFLVGEIARPGVYPIDEGRHRLSDMVKAAGGFLPTADLSAIRVHRRSPDASEKDPELDRMLHLSREQLTVSEYTKLTTRLAGLREDYRIDWIRLNESPRELDLLLRDGDIVRVERLVPSVRIDGEVTRPGILTFHPGQKVSDYVKQAGGYTERAWVERIRVTRSGSGQTLPAKNVKALDPGDFVWVPERPDKSGWDYIRETLTALAQVAAIVIAVDSVYH